MGCIGNKARGHLQVYNQSGYGLLYKYQDARNITFLYCINQTIPNSPLNWPESQPWPSGAPSLFQIIHNSSEGMVLGVGTCCPEGECKALRWPSPLRVITSSVCGPALGRGTGAQAVFPGGPSHGPRAILSARPSLLSGVPSKRTPTPTISRTQSPSPFTALLGWTVFLFFELWIVKASPSPSSTGALGANQNHPSTY